MARRRLTFLPAFFTTLAIVFVVALWVRIRSYRDDAPVATAATGNAQASAPLGAPGAVQPVIVHQQNATAPAPTETTTPTRRARRAAVPFVAPPPAATSSAAPPAAKPSNAPAKPSLLSRLVSPIVDAFSHGSKPAASGQQQQTSMHSGSSTSTSTTGTSSTADPNDPNSDTQPPQLAAISFMPPQIHDGEETTLTIQATDNLSGVRSISGTIAAPSGAVQGFACQRQGETEMYVARVAVPKEAAEGVWRVNYLSLIDNASNALTLTSAHNGLPATASFKVVSSGSDTQGPTLKSVWLDKPAMRAGEKGTIFVDAEDDKSGVNLISGVFISPSRHARIGFVCRPGQSGAWEGELSTPACIDCGDWQLEQVQLQDKANNMTTVRSDNPILANVHVNVTGDRCDSAAPEITSLMLDRNIVSNAQDSIISVSAIASDNACGIMSMSGQVTGPSTSAGAPRLYFSFTGGPDQPNWTGRITVPRLAAKGTWRVTWIQVLDQAHNLKTYSQADPALANAAFNVQ
ncbi:MAG TPA: hypothetical protein VLU46_06530 [Thermoanaerobaculia bacterium]|nr:hypothetical protein [Thermoanaerobaculia bacterium]